MTLDSDVLAVLETAKGWSAGDTAVGVVKSLSGSSPKVWLNGDSRRVFQWASVSKLLVAYASLLAVEEGTFALDDEAGPPGSTFRHLLAHASGLGPDAGPPLTRPGRRRIYSNAGYELVAALLSDKASMPFVEYLKAGVLDPLGMSSTDLPSGASPASGAEGNIYDLLSFTSELMRPRLISQATLSAATAVAFPGLAGVLPGFGSYDPCDWGLGFELRDRKAPHWTGENNSAATYGHFGRSGSFLWVDPSSGLGCAALCEREFGPWAKSAWPKFSDAVIRAADPGALASSNRYS